jgi:hypothetical protein
MARGESGLVEKTFERLAEGSALEGDVQSMALGIGAQVRRSDEVQGLPYGFRA